MEQQQPLMMDFSLETPEERTVLVQKIIDSTPPERLTAKYLEKLSDYIIFAMDKQERKEKKILTENRLVTVGKRETSFEGLVDKTAGGDSENANPDTIYNLFTNDKNIIFAPKITITDADVAEVPGLRELREAIAEVEREAKDASGRRAFSLKRQLIQMRQDQYVLKNMFRRPIHCVNLIKSIAHLDLSEEINFADDGTVKSTGIINLYDPAHVSALLCNYSRIKEDTWSAFSEDSRWLLLDLEKLIDDTFADAYPLYYDLIIYKIDGRTNLEIQELLESKYGIRHSEEYLSSLWRNKIPKMITERAAEEWIIWHYTMEERGKWKRCSCCKEIKPAHNIFFSKNSTSKDGFYSICKSCRSAKYKTKRKGE